MHVSVVAFVPESSALLKHEEEIDFVDKLGVVDFCFECCELASEQVDLFVLFFS